MVDVPVAPDRPAQLAPPVSSAPVLAYGVFGLPLAFAALPVYVHVPKLYVESVGLSLAMVGLVLLGARIIDALTDPLIGWLADRFSARRLMLALAVPLLGAGMVGLLVPPQGAGGAWLAALVFLVTLGFSVASINYHAWGATLGRDPVERTRFVASREGFGLVGVVLAAALPGVLAADMAAGLSRLAWLFVPLLIMAAAISLLFAPAPPQQRCSAVSPWRGLGEAFCHPPFIRLLGVFALNGIAAAIPATLVLFYVADVLQAEAWSGAFLVAYFVSAALSLPGWVWLSKRFGKLRAWLAAMLLAIASFAWAAMLGAGDTGAFVLICIVSGCALGADLSLPPAMLADLAARSPPQESSRTGTWFGWWNFVNKGNLALAAGLGLPLLALLGYVPGDQGGDGARALAGVYAIVPVVLKVFAAWLLYRLRHQLDFEGALQ